MVTRDPDGWAELGIDALVENAVCSLLGRKAGRQLVCDVRRYSHGTACCLRLAIDGLTGKLVAGLGVSLGYD